MFYENVPLWNDDFSIMGVLMKMTLTLTALLLTGSVYADPLISGTVSPAPKQDTSSIGEDIDEDDVIIIEDDEEEDDDDGEVAQK